MAMLNAPTVECDRVNLRRSVPVQKRQQIFETVPVRHRSTSFGRSSTTARTGRASLLNRSNSAHNVKGNIRKRGQGCPSPCSPMAIPETRSIGSPSITCRAGDYSPWAGRLSGRDSLPRAAIASPISLPMLLGVGLRCDRRLLRHPQHVLAQILLVGLVAGCGILGSPLNVHYSNYIQHVGLVLAVTKATK